MNFTFNGMFAEYGRAKKLMIAILIVLFLSGLFSSIGTIVNSLCDGSITGLKWLQFFSAMGTFVLTPLGIAYLISHDYKEYLSLNKTGVKYFALSILCIITNIPFINYITQLNEQMVLPEDFQAIENFMRAMEEKNKALTTAFLSVDTLGGFLANLVVLALIPAIGEELLFRGLIQKSVTNLCNNEHIGIWVAGTLFSAIHLQFYGFFPRMLMGVLFGYFLLWSRSILVPMSCHFFNNVTIVCTYYFCDSAATEELGKESLNVGVVSLILTLLLCFHLKLFRKMESNGGQSS